MTTGHKLGLRLFLEGIEVPVIGASITVAPNAPVTCALQVIATDSILDILPRTLVHLFFYDYVGGPSGSISHLPEDIENSAYKLTFTGEVQGLAFQKDAGNRMVMLNCVDLSNYWDTTYQYNFKGSLLGGRKHAAFIGANANWLTGPLGRGTGTIAALLNGNSVNYPNLKGLLAGIVRILEIIGGAYYGDTTFKGANDFSSIAELRLKILQQITAAERDDSTAKLFARKAFNRWMNRRMGGLGKLVTFRGLVQVLQKYVFHEIYPCPAPMYVNKVPGMVKTKTWAIDIAKDPRSRKFIADVKRLRNLVRSANKDIGDYPAASTGSVTRRTDTSTYTVTADQLVKELSNSLAAAHKLIRAMLTSTPNIPGVLKEVTGIHGALGDVDKQISSAHAGYVDAKYLSMGRRRGAAIKALSYANAACDTLLSFRVKKSKDITYEKLDRLNNQVFRPDIWFVPPPRCNVIFPETYTSLSWSRNFLREVSRLELQTTNEILGSDALFNGRYYAPNVLDMRAGAKMSSRKFGRLIMQHELLTGIIPMFEKLSEANLFAMQSRMVKHKGARVGYAQRAANFQYFKHRFASRQMQCQGQFNPWFVAGFPGLVVDRPMAADMLGEALNVDSAADLRKVVPTQFLGSCVQLTHSLNQQGGTTGYAFAQARIHREGTEYLGVDKAEVSKKVGEATRGTLVAAVPSRAPKSKKRGPRGGVVQEVTDVTRQYIDSFLPVYGAPKSDAKVQVGTACFNLIDYEGLPQSTPGGQEVSTDGSIQRTGSEYYKAYRVVEKFTRRERGTVDFPIEAAIRPPWIWDGYSNLRIGDTYMQFFGINAITDKEGYTSEELLRLVEEEEANEAMWEADEGKAHGEYEADDTSYFKDRKDPENNQGVSKKKKAGTQKKEAGKKIKSDDVLAMETDRTIEASVDYLVRVYSFIKHYGLDVGEFLKNYTWRPVATLPEMLGSVNFSILPKGDAGPLIENEDSKVEGEYVITGQEGFHSRAFGDTSDLFGLVDPRVKKVLGLTKDKEAVAKKLDMRGMKRAAVQNYISELAGAAGSRGLLG